MRFITGLTLVLILFVPSVSHAGKLADGFRGHPYGDPSWLDDEAPGDSCVKEPEESVPWKCSDKIGETPVDISYVVMEGLYVGVLITTDGFTNATNLLATLKAAYGNGIKVNDWDDSSLADLMWKDREVYASFKYNQFSGRTEVYISAMSVYNEAEALRKARAAQGAGDL